MEVKPIIFEDREQARMTSVSPDLRRVHREAIVKFRDWLRETGKVPDVETFKEQTKATVEASAQHPGKVPPEDARECTVGAGA